MNPFRILIATAIISSSYINPLRAGNIFDSSETNKTTLSIHAAYEYNDPSYQSLDGDNVYIHGRSGLNAGLTVGVPLWKNLFLAPGFSIFETQTGVEGVKDATRPVTFFWVMGGRIDCLIGYHFDFSEKFRLALTTGPQLALGFSSGWHYPGKKSDNTLYAEAGSFANRADFLWHAGLTATFSSHYSIAIGVSQGLTNRVGDFYKYFNPKPRIKDRLMSVSFGYTF